MATDPQRDAPWVMRTYSGHSTARASNELYRTNLAKGQTGLSIAFDLPTQTGYDPDAPEAAGEVGKVGVPVAHLGHMEELLDGIPVAGDEHLHDDQRHGGLAARALRRPRRGQGGRPGAALGHHAERHREGVPQPRDLHLPARARACASPSTPSPTRCATRRGGTRSTCAATTCRRPGPPRCRRSRTRSPPPSACSTACAPRARSTTAELPAVVGRISFFVNSSVRFVEETCKMRAFTALWDRICRERYGVEDPKLRRFRYGVQVNSLGLTEQQPENNVQRIVLETLGVTLSKDARARAMQLPAWNEALGLPRPWDQQWSLRMQQVLAFESDLLEYGDIFEGSVVVEAKTAELAEAACGRAGRRGGARRRLRGHRRAQAAPGAQPGRAGAPHRDGRAEGGGRQLLHRDRAVAPPRRRRDREHPARSTTASRPSRSRTWSAGGPRATGPPCAPRSTSCAGSPPTTGPDGQHHGGDHRPGPRRRHDGGVGGRAARGVRRVPRPHRRRRRGGAARRRPRARSGSAPGRWPSAPAARPASSWPSPGSTGTPTGPSRSPWRRATPASR